MTGPILAPTKIIPKLLSSLIEKKDRARGIDKVQIKPKKTEDAHKMANTNSILQYMSKKEDKNVITKEKNENKNNICSK